MGERVGYERRLPSLANREVCVEPSACAIIVLLNETAARVSNLSIIALQSGQNIGISSTPRSRKASHCHAVECSSEALRDQSIRKKYEKIDHRAYMDGIVVSATLFSLPPPHFATKTRPDTTKSDHRHHDYDGRFGHEAKQDATAKLHRR
jgi:hypothetical protein